MLVENEITQINSIYRCLFFCSIGNILEWYDFSIYGILSPILAKVFFPDNTLTTSILLTFLLFAIGFLVRPIGGLLFGYIADKYGRSKALTYSLILTAIPALCITLLPTYVSWGWTSVLLLLIFRLLQGFAVGGEYPALITYLSEISPPEKRGYFCSYSNLTTVMGVLMSTCVVGALNLFFSEETILEWAWRIPFALTFFSVLLGFYLRLKLTESTFFLSIKKEKLFSISLWYDTFKKDSLNMLKIFGVVFCAGVSYYTYNLFMVSYLMNQIHFSYKQALILSFSGGFLLALLIPVSGWLSDRIGRKKVIYFGIFGLVFFSYPLFSLFDSEAFYRAFIIQTILAVILSFYFGSLPSLITEQLSTSSRGACVALSYGIGIALSGGTAPIINLYLIEYWHNIFSPGIYISLSGTIALCSVFFMKEMYGKPLEK